MTQFSLYLSHHKSSNTFFQIISSRLDGVIHVLSLVVWWNFILIWFESRIKLHLSEKNTLRLKVNLNLKVNFKMLKRSNTNKNKFMYVFLILSVITLLFIIFHKKYGNEPMLQDFQTDSLIPLPLPLSNASSIKSKKLSNKEENSDVVDTTMGNQAGKKIAMYFQWGSHFY